MFSGWQLPVITYAVWVALAVGLSSGSVAGYKIGHWFGDNSGYSRAIKEQELKAEKEVADALEKVNRDRRNRPADGVPNVTDPNDRK